jgi:5-methylcytosine-specific restriction protein A
MSRSTEEWSGRTDNSAAPPRVRVRLYLDAKGKCKLCTRFIDGCKLTAQADHVIALINGGKNCESNMQLVCNECHKVKTKADVAEKSITARKRAKHLGIKKPRTMTRWRKFNGEIVSASRERS